MDQLEQIRQFLLTYPEWGEAELTVDHMQLQPGAAGLFFQGMQELDRQDSIWGNSIIQNRLRFVLRRVFPTGGSGAAWMLAFQDWVQQESCFGHTPQLGMGPGRERLYAHQGCLENAREPGLQVYRVVLDAEYITYRLGRFDNGSA